MTKTNRAILCSTSVFICLMMSSAGSSAAQLTPNINLETDLRFQGSDDDNQTFGGPGSGNTSAGSAEAKFRLTANINEDSLFFWEGRAVGGVGKGQFQSSDTGQISTAQNFLEWRQSYFQFDNLGNQPVQLRLGRQRVSEPYGLWWNENFDAARVNYETTLFKGSLIAGQDLLSYKTSGDNFSQNDHDIARIIGEGSWQYHYQQFFETRFMLQDDYSGIARVGDIESADNRNDDDGKLAWAGVRATGKSDWFLENADKLQYRVDLLGVGGHEKFATTSLLPSGDRRITANDGRDVMGWALDAAVDMPLPIIAQPLLHLGYAYGSGDSNTGDGTDHAFRQSSLEGNFSQIGVLSQSADNYGTVLRPELSNIHVLAAGFTMPAFGASDFGTIYRYYRLAEPATTVTTRGSNITLNGRNRDLGQGVDVLFNTDLGREFNLKLNHIHNLSLRTSIGAFRAGEAFGSSSGETAWRGLAELKITF